MKFSGNVYVFRFSKENREILEGKVGEVSWNVDEMEIDFSLEISGEYFANRKSKGNISKFEKRYIYIYMLRMKSEYRSDKPLIKPSGWKHFSIYRVHVES